MSAHGGWEEFEIDNENWIHFIHLQINKKRRR